MSDLAKNMISCCHCGVVTNELFGDIEECAVCKHTFFEEESGCRCVRWFRD